MIKETNDRLTDLSKFVPKLFNEKKLFLIMTQNNGSLRHRYQGCQVSEKNIYLRHR
jgi:hypothetical protein